MVSTAAARATSAGAWLECVRAPLLVRTLRTYGQLPGSRKPAELQRIWGSLLQLSCSPQEDVRRAVALYL